MRLKLLAAASAVALACVAPAAFAADNVAVTVGSGKTMACKDIAAVCYGEHMLVDHLGAIVDPMPATGGTVGLVAGSAIVGKVGIDQTAPGTTDSVTTKATENHTGEVGSNITTITVAQTVTASSAYAAGNAIGGLMTLSNAVRVSGSIGASGTGALLQDVSVNAKSAQNTLIDVFVFNANPTGSACIDKTAFVLATADFNKLVAVAHITDWTAGNVASFGQATGYAKTFNIASGTTAYACAVTRSTPTYTATSDLSFNFGLARQ